MRICLRKKCPFLSPESATVSSLAAIAPKKAAKTNVVSGRWRNNLHHRRHRRHHHHHHHRHDRLPFYLRGKCSQTDRQTCTSAHTHTHKQVVQVFFAIFGLNLYPSRRTFPPSSSSFSPFHFVVFAFYFFFFVFFVFIFV